MRDKFLLTMMVIFLTFPVASNASFKSCDDSCTCNTTCVTTTGHETIEFETEQHITETKTKLETVTTTTDQWVNSKWYAENGGSDENGDRIRTDIPRNPKKSPKPAIVAGQLGCIPASVFSKMDTYINQDGRKGRFTSKDGKHWSGWNNDVILGSIEPGSDTLTLPDGRYAQKCISDDNKDKSEIGLSTKGGSNNKSYKEFSNLIHLITSTTSSYFTSETLSYDIFTKGYYDHEFSTTVCTTTGGGGSPVPEPGTLLLFGSGILGLVAFNKRIFKK